MTNGEFERVKVDLHKFMIAPESEDPFGADHTVAFDLPRWLVAALKGGALMKGKTQRQIVEEALQQHPAVRDAVSNAYRGDAGYELWRAHYFAMVRKSIGAEKFQEYCRHWDEIDNLNRSNVRKPRSIDDIGRKENGSNGSSAR